MKTIYWGLLSLWLALAGCTKGVDDEPTPAGATPATDETPFYGTIETDADTRCATKRLRRADRRPLEPDRRDRPLQRLSAVQLLRRAARPERSQPLRTLFQGRSPRRPVRRRDDRIRRQLCAPSLLRRRRGLRQGRRRTDDDLLAARHAALQRRGARRHRLRTDDGSHPLAHRNQPAVHGGRRRPAPSILHDRNRSGEGDGAALHRQRRRGRCGCRCCGDELSSRRASRANPV